MSQTTGTAIAHPARVALSALDDALAGLAEANLWSMTDAELLELRADLETSRARLDAQVLAATREVDARGAAVATAVATGAASTAAWLRHRLLLHRLLLHPGAAKAEVSLAAEVDRELTETGAALTAGAITLDQAAAVAGAMRGLPGAVDPATRRQAEGWLLEQAAQFDPAALHKLGRHLVQVLDPEGGAALEREEALLASRQTFTVSHGADRSRPVRGQFGPEGGALLDAALAAVSAPRPSQDGTPDPRTAGQRRAEGLLELIKLAMQADEMPELGGEPVTLTVTTTADYLTAATDAATANRPAATLEDGTALSPEATRRLGCDAWLVAAIVDTDLDVLDIGRMSRVIPRSMRRALIVRDQGCAFHGCGRPPRWCHSNGHHIWFWADGGPTALSNLALLCGHHHHLVHHHGWDVDIGPDGHPRFYPPPWIDPSRTPRPPWRPPTIGPDTSHSPGAGRTA
jgi:uncharacterized protein DUF222